MKSKILEYLKSKKQNMSKKLIIYPALVAVVVTLFSFIGSGPGAELTLNAALPMADAKMKDVSGKTVSLAEKKT